MHQESGLLKYEDIIQFKTMTFGDEELKKQTSNVEEAKNASPLDYVIAPP